MRRRGHARVDRGEHLVFFHDQVVDAVKLDLLTGVLAEQDGVALLHVQRDTLALVGDLAVTRGDDRAALRLLLRGIRNDDPADVLFAFFQALNEDSVV